MTFTAIASPMSSSRASRIWTWPAIVLPAASALPPNSLFSSPRITFWRLRGLAVLDHRVDRRLLRGGERDADLGERGHALDGVVQRLAESDRLLLRVGAHRRGHVGEGLRRLVEDVVVLADAVADVGEGEKHVLALLDGQAVHAAHFLDVVGEVLDVRRGDVRGVAGALDRGGGLRVRLLVRLLVLDGVDQRGAQAARDRDRRDAGGLRHDADALAGSAAHLLAERVALVADLAEGLRELVGVADELDGEGSVRHGASSLPSSLRRRAGERRPRSRRTPRTSGRPCPRAGCRTRSSSAGPSTRARLRCTGALGRIACLRPAGRGVGIDLAGAHLEDVLAVEHRVLVDGLPGALQQHDRDGGDQQHVARAQAPAEVGGTGDAGDAVESSPLARREAERGVLTDLDLEVAPVDLDDQDAALGIGPCRS
jgi:hypothetical protein